MIEFFVATGNRLDSLLADRFSKLVVIILSKHFHHKSILNVIVRDCNRDPISDGALGAGIMIDDRENQL